MGDECIYPKMVIDLAVIQQRDGILRIWDDGTSCRVKLKDMKLENPIETTEYCKMKDLMEESPINS